MLIREIILENFMSYEYARIPLESGLNVICGPNGSGKSAILLAISVALGQAYTERARKLSDLIRWGKDSARVTVVFNNTRKNGRRPVPKFDVDYFRISRYIQKDGNYWFEANFKAVNKSEVTNILKEFGINPDNMLIIMHQRMMENFGMTTSRERLVMVEEAVGLFPYRQQILEAQEKLSQVLSEEESVQNLLETAEETLAYWKEEYQKYQRRKELLKKKSYLEQELIWARMIKQENIVDSWKREVKRKEEKLADLSSEIEKISAMIVKLNKKIDSLRFEREETFHTLLTLEKDRTEHKVIVEIQSLTLEKIGLFKQNILEETVPESLREHIESWNEYIQELNSQVEFSGRRVQDLDEKIAATQMELARLEREFNSVTRNYLNERVGESLLCFQRESCEGELKECRQELSSAEEELNQLEPSLDKAQSRIEIKRQPQEVYEEIKIINVQLSALGVTSRDVETMYTKYRNLFNELKAKVKVVAENRERALKEIEDRKKTWRRLLQSMLDEIDGTYKEFLVRVQGRGYVKLTDIHDIELAGLEMYVGFKGAEPSILDAYTQSGGERSTTTMAFLLALQQHLKSPFRAVDEFDVHMDPRNREIISDMLIKEVRRIEDIQYVTITPSRISSLGEDIHVITVQNMHGKSEVKVVD